MMTHRRFRQVNKREGGEVFVLDGQGLFMASACILILGLNLENGRLVADFCLYGWRIVRRAQRTYIGIPGETQSRITSVSKTPRGAHLVANGNPSIIRSSQTYRVSRLLLTGFDLPCLN